MARTNTKATMVFSAVKLLSERGVHGLTIDAVLADSGAPRGSVYHHFRGGRSELLLEAARAGSAYITGILTTAVEAGDAATALDMFVEFWRRSLVGTDYRAGCPIAALLAGEDVPAEVREVARTAFATWTLHLANALTAAGATAGEADRLASMTISSIEGAITLCRASGTADPLDIAAEQLRAAYARTTAYAASIA